MHISYPRFKRLDQYKSFTFPQGWMTIKDRKRGVTKRLEVVKLGPVAPSEAGGELTFAHLSLPGRRDILDYGWGTLIRFVTYKSEMLRGNRTHVK